VDPEQPAWPPRRINARADTRVGPPGGPAQTPSGTLRAICVGRLSLGDVSIGPPRHSPQSIFAQLLRGALRFRYSVFPTALRSGTNRFVPGFFERSSSLRRIFLSKRSTTDSVVDCSCSIRSARASFMTSCITSPKIARGDDGSMSSSGRPWISFNGHCISDANLDGPDRRGAVTLPIARGRAGRLPWGSKTSLQAFLVQPLTKLYGPTREVEGVPTIHAFRPDPLIPRCKGSMRASIEPASG
jgi:hypothetical protein